MSLNQQERREISSDANFFGRQAIKWVIIGVVVVAVLSALAWGINVAISKPKGEGDAARQKNQAKNWVAKQKEFNQRYQAILAMDKNIGLAYDEKHADPKSEVKQINYSGLVRNCNDAVGAYNSLAREYDAQDFRDADLPSEIDSTNPNTDCKEG